MNGGIGNRSSLVAMCLPIPGESRPSQCLGCYSSRRLKDAKKWGICLTQVARVLSSHVGREAELVECTGKLGGAAAGAVRDGLHLLFDRL